MPFFLVNKTAHTCWWTWLTSTFALKAAHIEHGLESKRRWQFYTILQKKLMKSLMFKCLWVLPCFTKQGSSTSSVGGWKLVSEITFHRILKSLCPFWPAQFQCTNNSIQFWLTTSSLWKLIFSLCSVNTFISLLTLPVRDQLSITKMQASEY